MTENIQLLVIGGAIALVSSLITGWFNYRLEMKRRKAEREQDRWEKNRKEAQELHQKLTYTDFGPLRYGSPSTIVFCRLKVESGPDLGINLTIQKHVTVIGRAPELCDLTLSDTNIADKHLRLVVADGIFVLEDISGGHMVHINNLPISTPCVIDDDDLIKIGESILHFQAGPE